MSFLSVFYILLFYTAIAIFVAGLSLRIYKYARTPVPLKIPTMPAPLTKTGVVMRMGREVVLFESLFKANKWTWAFGFLFHASLLLAFFRHLRYAMSPNNIFWPLVDFHYVQLFGKYAGFTMVLGLAGLLARRIFVDRVRYISSPSDFLMLLLLISIGATGLLMTFVSAIDIMQLRDFARGLIILKPAAVPNDPILLIHLALVALLMMIFPISKLLHAPGVFFSPSRNQVDNSREKRHLAPWAAALDATRGSKKG